MSKNHISCENMKFKIMAFIDNELPESDINFVKNHLEQCIDCRNKFDSLTKVKEITGEMKFKKLPEMYWDEYWSHVYNKIERGIGWIFISVGAIIVLSFALWYAFDSLVNTPMSPFLKTGIFILSAGVVVLIVSVLREKLMVKKIDKYRKVQR